MEYGREVEMVERGGERPRGRTRGATTAAGQAKPRSRSARGTAEVLELDLLPLGPLYEASPIGVLLVDRGGNILAANPAFQSLLGQSEAELQGRLVASLLDDDDEWPGVNGGDVRLVDEGGKRIWVHVSEADAALPGKGARARLVLVRDETEERRLGRELEVARSQFQQIADNVHDGFVLLTPDLRRIVHANAPLVGLLAGVADGAVDGPASLDDLHPDDRVRLLEAAPRLQKERIDLQIRLVNADGSVRAWLQMRMFPLDDPVGEVRHVAGIVEDVTGRKRVAEMLAQARQHAARLVQTVQDPHGIVRGGDPRGLTASGPSPLWLQGGKNAERQAFATRSAALTPREREVMELLVAGGTTKAMAAELALSPKTVEVYRARVMKKMEAPSVAALVRLVLLGSPQHGQ